MKSREDFDVFITTIMAFVDMKQTAFLSISRLVCVQRDRTVSDIDVSIRIQSRRVFIQPEQFGQEREREDDLPPIRIIGGGSRWGGGYRQKRDCGKGRQ